MRLRLIEDVMKSFFEYLFKLIFECQIWKGFKIARNQEMLDFILRSKPSELLVKAQKVVEIHMMHPVGNF